MRHFLKSTDFSLSEVENIFALASQLKSGRGQIESMDLEGQSWALLFFKPSTRTRISFEIGIKELGGNTLYLTKNDIQSSRGESIADTAKGMSRYLHGIIIRCYDHALLEELA